MDFAGRDAKTYTALLKSTSTVGLDFVGSRMEKLEYQIFDISEYEPEIFEALGTKSKFWLKDKNGNSILFKSNTCLDKSGNEIVRPGEDWAEKIACEIAQELGIPHAHYELAAHNGKIGVITESFVPNGYNMTLGNVLLAHLTQQETVTLNRKSSNRLSRVFAILTSMVHSPPIGWAPTKDIRSATDVFCGYLMLDLLISNQDRHEENWGVLIDQENNYYLCPSFDHAASLGRNESDTNRLAKLNSNDIGQSLSTYINKAKSQLYDRQGKRYKTIDAFTLTGAFSPSACLEWIHKLKSIPFIRIDEIVDAVPSERMSKVAKEFTKALIKENMTRVAQCEAPIRRYLK